MSVWTYVGQIINFLAFVVILYFLLYKPMGRVMQRRKQEMEAELREAEKKLQEADKIRAQAEKREKELEEKRESILKETRDQAEAHRKELLQKAEDEGRGRLQRFRRIMEQERNELLDNITDELRETIVQVAGSALSDASSDLADRALERVETLLEAMPKKELDSARKALGEQHNRVPVRSAGTLTNEHLQRLSKLLVEKLGLENIELELKEDPSLLAGVELTLGHIHLEAHWRGVIDEALENQQNRIKEPKQEQKRKEKPSQEAKPEPEEEPRKKGTSEAEAQSTKDTQ